jgi:general secretion pathway protein M
LQDKFFSLSRREQGFLVAGFLGVAVFLMAELVFLPTYREVQRLTASIQTKERDLGELKSLSAKYKRLEAGKTDTDRPKGESFSLFSVLERFATESGLMDKIEYMRPGTSQLDPSREEKWVEVKLVRVTLREFTDYLNRIQSHGGIYLKRLSARKEGDTLTLILQPAVTELK